MCGKYGLKESSKGREGGEGMVISMTCVGGGKVRKDQCERGAVGMTIGLSAAATSIGLVAVAADVALGGFLDGGSEAEGSCGVVSLALMTVSSPAANGPALCRGTPTAVPDFGFSKSVI